MGTRPNTVVSIIVYLSVIVHTLSKTFTKCELITELKRHDFAQNQLEDWACLVEAESSGRTDAVGGPDSDGSYDYGLFQINDRYWCSTGEMPGKGCNVRCIDLLSDDISKSLQCAKKIYRIQGFYAWAGWLKDCMGKDLSQLAC